MTDTEPENLLQKAFDDVTHMLEAKRLLRQLGPLLIGALKTYAAEWDDDSDEAENSARAGHAVQTWLDAEHARNP